MEILFLILIGILCVAFIYVAFKHVIDHEKFDRKLYNNLINPKRTKKRKK